MKVRNGYVSNSSSSSFLVPSKAELPCTVDAIKLPEDIWRRIEKYHADYDGKGIDLSSVSGEWSLTCLVSDCMPEYEKVSGIPGAVQYLEGDSIPYGAYDEGDDYVTFRKDGEEYWVLASDLIGTSEDDIPGEVWLRQKAREVLDSGLTAGRKITLLKKIFR